MEVTRVPRRRAGVGAGGARHVGPVARRGACESWRARIATAALAALVSVVVAMAAQVADVAQTRAARDARERELVCQHVGVSAAFWRGIRCSVEAIDGAPPPLW